MLKRNIIGLTTFSNCKISRAIFRHCRSISTTRNEDEISKFRGLDWDGAEGQALSAMHRTRMKGIMDYMRSKHGVHSLEGMRVLDIGCGGGLLSRSLVDLGATVVGVDPVEENVERTRQAVSKSPIEDVTSRFDGRVGTVEDIMKQEGPKTFDMVLSLEVIEHVDNQSGFVSACCMLTRNALVLSTMNRTVKSYLLDIVAAEYIARMVPVGTHDWFKFVQPVEIERVVHDQGLHTDAVVGMVFNPICGSWHLAPSETDANYLYFASR